MISPADPFCCFQWNTVMSEGGFLSQCCFDVSLTGLLSIRYLGPHILDAGGSVLNATSLNLKR